MDTLDAAVYCIIISLAIFLLYTEFKHFVCDSLSCSMYRWNSEMSVSEKDLYKKLLDGQTRQSVWMRSYVISTIIVFIVYWWFGKSLPRSIEFISLLAIIFFLVYFGIVFYQHHFLHPINSYIKEYIESSCGDKYITV